MKKTGFMRAALLLLVLTLITSCFVGGTFAKYTTSATGDTGKINAAEQTAAFTNKKDGSIDMGVMLDSMPYVLVLAVVGAAVIALIAKKRRAED